MDDLHLAARDIEAVFGDGVDAQTSLVGHEWVVARREDVEDREVVVGSVKAKPTGWLPIVPTGFMEQYHQLIDTRVI
jgi:hypothetical protein